MSDNNQTIPVETTLCVGDLMTRNTVTTCDTDSMASAISKMHTHSLSSLPVVDRENKVCGVLSSQDLLQVAHSVQSDVSVLEVVSDCVRKTLTNALARDNSRYQVKDFMTRSVHTAMVDTLVSDAARQLVAKGIHHLPVVDSNGSVVGILSSMDIVRAVAS